MLALCDFSYALNLVRMLFAIMKYNKYDKSRAHALCNYEINFDQKLHNKHVLPELKKTQVSHRSD